MKITINGEETEFNTDSLFRFTELVELIKSNIDPEHMITNILLDGSELTDKDWFSSINQIKDCKLEILTGTPQNYAAERFAMAASIIRACFMDFRAARKYYINGKNQLGNDSLVVAVKNLQAFFQWYASLSELLSAEEKEKYNIDSYVRDISETCKKICQHQIYQSWMGLADTLKHELEPKLEELEDACAEYEQ